MTKINVDATEEVKTEEVAEEIKEESAEQQETAEETTENVEAIRQALDKRELVKISVLQNCEDDAREIAEVIAERTRSQVVQVIGKKIVLYKEGKDKNKKIELPKAKKKDA